jgi:hypothetical protein
MDSILVEGLKRDLANLQAIRAATPTREVSIVITELEKLIALVQYFKL